MVDSRVDVSGFVLEQLEAICHGSEDGSDQPVVVPVGLADVRRLADRIEAAFGVRPPDADLCAAASVRALGVLVQAALTRRRAAVRTGSDPAAPAGSADPAAPAGSAPSGEAEPLRPGPPSHGDHDGPAPLSRAQRRIWFMQQLAADSPLYTVPTRLDLVGPLDVEALRAALTDLLDRHEILRTRYPVRSGVPGTEVLPAGGVDLPLAVAPTAHEVQRLADEQARAAFRLDRDLPVRFLLARRAADQHVLIATFHHIAVDAVTLDLLFRDLGALYGRHVTGRPAAEPPSWRYADHARQEATAAEFARLRLAAARRRAALGDAPFPLELPTDLVRPRFQRFRGNAESGVLDEPLTTGVRRLARRQGVTPFAVLLAALAIVLSRAAGRPAVVVGTPAAGRTAPQWRDVAGCFVNMVPVLVTVQPEMSGEQLVGGVGEAVWQAIEAQDIPFEEVASAAHRRRNVPPLTVMFSYQVTGAPVGFAGLADVTPRVSRPPDTAKYDLSLYAVATGPELRLELEYDTDLYTARTARSVLDAYHAQVAALVADPAALVDTSGPSGFEVAAAARPAEPDPSRHPEQVVTR